MDKNLEQENKPKQLSFFEKILIITIRRKKIFFVTLITFLAFGFLRTFKESIFNSLYEGEFTLLISDPINSSKGGGISASASAAAMFDLNSSIEQDIPTLRKLLKSEVILKDISKKFKLSPKGLAGRIRIEEDFTASGILDIYLQSNNPKEDEKLLNELSLLYVNYATTQKQKKLSDGLSFLNAQEPAMREKNYKLREKVEKYMIENNVVDPLLESQKKKERIADMENLIQTNKKQIERLSDLKSKTLEGEFDINRFTEIISDANGYTKLKISNPAEQITNQYELLNIELGEALLTYTPNSSIVKNIESRIAALNPLIKEKQLETIEKAIKAYETNNNLNKISLQKLNEEFDLLTGLIKEYLILEFELKAATKNLSAINDVKEKLQFEIAQDSRPWSIIKEPKFKPNRIYPSFRRELINFFLFGAFAGVILSLLRDKFDNVYHSPKEIENEIKAPILGNVPYVDYFSDIREKKKSLIELFSSNADDNKIDSYDKFFYQEALRNIYTSIRFINSDKPLKVIVVTSSIPKEGKSLTNILLAKTLCEMDLKILLIDADLRKPQLHLRLGLNNITGLSNILTDKEITASDAIQKVPGFKNWDVITSGTIPPDPTRLLQSKSMEIFIQDLKKDKKYDLVLIDTPPVIGLADSLLVSEKSDGLILIVSTDQVPRDLPKESINKTLESGAYFVGMVTNATKKPQPEFINNYAYGSYNYSYIYNTYADTDEIPKNEINDQSNFSKTKLIILENLNKLVSKAFKWLDN